MAQQKLIEEKLTIEQLEQFLWKTADILRGPIEVSEYKNYILTLLFYKRLSDVWQEEYEELLKKYKSEKLAKEKYHRFKIPDSCLWEDIRKVTKSVGKTLNDVLEKIARSNPDELDGVINRVDFADTYKLSEERVIRLIEHFSQYKLGNRNVETDVLGQAYEYLIKQFADTAGKKGGEFYTPKEVVRALVGILDPKEGDEIYDPTCGSGGMLVEAHFHLERKGKDPKRLFLFGQEINVLTWAIAKMNVVLHNLEADMRQGDTLADPKFLEGSRLQKFDMVVANPMWNQKDGIREAIERDKFGRFPYGTPPESSADWGWVQHMLASLKQNGRMGIVLDQGVLFRGGAEGEIRKKVIEEDLVECVIALPEKLFYNTGAPGCMLILNKAKPKERKGKILFVYSANNFEKLKNMNRLRDEDVERIVGAYQKFKGMSKYAHVASVDNVKENDYNLSVTRYVEAFAEEEQIDVKEAWKMLQKAEEDRKQVDQKVEKFLKELKV